jgi:release factor glutamine methyltransferase
MSAKNLFDTMLAQIQHQYELSEAKSLLFWWFREALQLSKAAILLDQKLPDPIDYQPVVDRLLAHEPIQYIVGHTHFLDRQFEVNPAVLIPRPETEELILTLLQKIDTAAPLTLLDVGTGSGCVAISLALALPQAQVWAIDVSAGALALAQRNAERLGARVTFGQIDMLQWAQQIPAHWPSWDVVVSNPPYVTPAEAASMKAHVLDFEPHVALFAPEEAPLIFYQKIAQLADQQLKKNGWIALEINEYLGPETVQCFDSQGYEAELKRDIFEKNRFVFAQKK